MVYKGDCKPADEWRNLLADYNGIDEITVFNESGKTVSSVCQSATRYLIGKFGSGRVISRNGVIIINPTLKQVTRVPGYLYYAGDWEEVYREFDCRLSAPVVNLTSSLQMTCDFVKQLNRYLLSIGCSELEARSVKGMCILGTKEYFSNPEWRNDWRLRKHV